MEVKWIIFGLFLNGLYYVDSISFKTSENSYALYPVWNACPNASVSFDFKTNESKAFLFYVDDQTGVGYDFIQIHVENGKVRMVSNIVDGNEGNVQIVFQNLVNDSKWHTVKYQRNRMKSIMTLDGKTKQTVAFGSDFKFGITPNTYTWFGGINPKISYRKINLPSVILIPRFQGSLRNIVYQNCTCESIRVSPLEGMDYSLSPKENCERNNPCRKGCLCISNDLDQPLCDCSQLECSKDKDIHYHLPMDKYNGNMLENYGGLDASIYGSKSFVQGVNNKAVRLDGLMDYIVVSGPSHRFECFGDLTLCDDGYTLAQWIKILPPISNKKHVYISNGGHSDKSHGIALIYQKGWLYMKFKNKEGMSWEASAKGILPGHWYHVVGTWNKLKSFAKLYINGKESHSKGGVKRDVSIEDSNFNEYVIGRTNLPLKKEEAWPILVDEFHFWPHYKNPKDARELGPLYSVKLSFNEGEESQTQGVTVSRIGSPKRVKGTMGDAMEFDGRDDFIIIKQQGKPTCFTNLSMCLYGVTVASWVKFKDVTQMSYLLHSNALQLYLRNQKIHLEANKDGNVWKTEREDVIEKDKWYYIEGTWDEQKGARVFINHKNGVSSSNFNPSSKHPPSNRDPNLVLIAKSQVSPETSNVVLDEFEMFYGDRERLNNVSFRLTGRPDKDHVTFDHLPDTSSQFQVNTFGTPRVVSGPVERAYEFDGSEYVSLGRQDDSCLGNLDFCQHGALMSAWIKPTHIEPDMHLFSTGSNGLKGRYVSGGRLELNAKTTSYEWQLISEPLNTDQWQFIEAAWNPDDGLKLYVNQELVKKSDVALDRTDQAPLNPITREFYVGRGDGVESASKFGKFAIDDLEYWHANREYLIAFGYIQRGKPSSMHIDMDIVNNNYVAHDNLFIQSNVPGKIVPGKIRGAYELDGRRNFLKVNNLPHDCFNDLQLCTHGLTTAFFVNFQKDDNDQFYFSNGGGVSIYQKNKQKFVSFVQGEEKWEAPINVGSGDWHFLESSWHPNKGLKVNVDNRLTNEVTTPQKVPSSNSGVEDFLFGNGNERDKTNSFDVIRPGKASIDEFEMWQSEKDYLDAFGYVLRDKVPHYSFPMEKERGNKLTHPDVDITKFNGARLSGGKVGKALELGGNGEFVSFGDQGASCLGNLDKCPHGLTTSFLIKPSQNSSPNLKHYFMSSGAYSFYSQGNEYTAVYQQGDKQWLVTTDGIKPDEWQKVEMSWREDKGLKLMKDGNVIGQALQPRITPQRVRDRNLYLGRPTDDQQTDSSHGKGLIDELEFWFSNIDHLKAFDLISDDQQINSLKVNMDEIEDGYVNHPTRLIPTQGNPSVVEGVNKGAVRLNGQGQYLDLGSDVICNNDPRFCPNGFTTRIKLKPHRMLDGSYVLSSPFTSLSKQGGRLLGEVWKGDKKWQTRSKPIEDEDWRQVDMSWHPSEGMVMYVNNEKVDEISIPIDSSPDDHGQSDRFYVGHADTTSVNQPYAKVDVDDLEFYEAKRESLLPNLIQPDMDQRRIDSTRNTGTTNIPPTLPELPTDQGKAVTFVSEGAQVTLPAWSKPESLSFKFATSQPNALLFHQQARPRSISVEVFDGVAYTNVGSEKYVFPSSTPLNDNQAHKATVTLINQRSIQLTMDGKSKTYQLKSPLKEFTSSGGLLVAGVADSTRQLPNYIWNNQDTRKYVGCLWGVNVNMVYADLNSLLSQQSNVKSQCSVSALKCKAGLCGEGKCMDVWQGYKCDCSKTNYVGKNCNKASVIGSFSGNDYVRMNFKGTTSSNTDDFSTRFRTLKEDGLILATSNNKNDDQLKLSIDRGRGKVETNFDSYIQEMYFNCAYKLNDAAWHTLYVKRRASYIEMKVDDCPKASYYIQGEKTQLDIDNIHIGKQSLSDPFIGSMRNIIVKDISVLDNLPSDRLDGLTIERDVLMSTTEANILYPVTFRDHPSSILQLHPLNSIYNTELHASFKTSHPDGLLLYNGDPSKKYFALELHQGQIRVLTNDKVKVLRSATSLADDKWHTLTLKPATNKQHHLNISLDELTSPQILDLGSDYFDLGEALMVGGVPKNMSISSKILSSRKGFAGCLASVSINGRVFDLMNDAVKSSSYVTSGCTDTSAFCAPDLCNNGGVCHELKDSFHCDCSLTSFIGPYCHTESSGLRIGGDDGRGINIYRIDPPSTTQADNLAFGFMTWRENGTLVNLQGNNDFIEASLNKGSLEFEYNIGDGRKKIVEDGKVFNDGSYHYASLVRRGEEVEVKVDDLPVHKITGSNKGTFNRMSLVKLGGDMDSNNKIIKSFDGILAGVHLNSFNLIQEEVQGKRIAIKKTGVFSAQHPFYLPKPTEAPVREKNEDDLWFGKGGGAGWGDIGVVFAGSNVPRTGALMQVPAVGVERAFPRAAAVAGAMIGILVATSSLMWAAYKFKPGMFSTIGFSSPSYHAVATTSAKKTDFVASSTDGGFEMKSAVPFKSNTQESNIYDTTAAFTTLSRNHGYSFNDNNNDNNVYNNNANNTYNNNANNTYDINTANSVFDNRQVTPDGMFNNDSLFAANTLNYQNNNQQNSFAQQQTLQQQTLQRQQQASSLQQQNLELNFQQQQHFLPTPTKQMHYSTGSSTTFQQQQHYPPQQQQNYQTQQQHYPLQQQTQQQFSQQQFSQQPPPQPPFPNLMGSEEIRVDCVQLSTNGRYVVTGSIYGPPQVWDMKTGELVRIMQGENLSSTDLHLANGDSLLIGQVAEQSQNDFSPDVINHNYRKLQIWDFSSGRCIEMKKNELCTASCMMADGERLVMGRTDRMGQGSTIVIWDILGNEPIRHLNWHGFVGSYDDPLTFITLSKDNRYILAGTQNSSDTTANYATYDLTTTDYNKHPPNIVSFNADVATTVVIENQEAVTGTRSGELIVWSLRTGKVLRQLMCPLPNNPTVASTAHQAEVKGLCVSKDALFLVSSSADGTLKVWNLETERLERTLSGHMDEVLCCSISNDNELVVSGSADQTIRLWRLDDGQTMASIQAGIDVFKVLLSNNKKTIVALADKLGARKLVMLQVVRTKVASTTASRATSPLSNVATPNYNFR